MKSSQPPVGGFLRPHLSWQASLPLRSNEKSPPMLASFSSLSDRARIRTWDRLLRRQMLYPAELRDLLLRGKYTITPLFAITIGNELQSQFAQELSVRVRFRNHKAFSIISSTTSGFSRVLISPRLEVSLEAIFRKMRRIILPLRVLGRPETN